MVSAGRSVLFQDRRGAGRGGNSRGSARCDHDVSSARHQENGEEERDRPQSSVRRNSRLYVGHLFGQDGHTDDQPDVGLPRKFVLFCYRNLVNNNAGWTRKTSLHSAFDSTVLFLFLLYSLPSVLWHCWLGDRKGIRPVKSWVLVCW